MLLIGGLPESTTTVESPTQPGAGLTTVKPLQLFQVEVLKS